MGNGCNVSQHSVLLLKTKTTNLKRYSETKCIACVSCKLYMYSQSQCLAWDTKRLQHADVIQTSTETSIRLRVSESLEILPPQAQKTPQEVSLHLITFFFPWWCFTYYESALQMHVWSKKTTMRSFWHLIPVSSCHYRSTVSLVEVFRSSDIYLSRHFVVTLVLSLSPKWNLAFLKQHYIPSHQTPPLPSPEFQRDLIGLEKNKNTLSWKWSGGLLCCIP